MAVFELTVIVCGVLMAIGIAMLIAISLKLAARMKNLNDDYTALEAKFAALREQNQQELLAIGQRVLEADKIVRRFSERLDAIENNSGSEQPQYGQLQDLLKQAGNLEGEASAAEKELLSLLTRNRKLSS